METREKNQIKTETNSHLKQNGDSEVDDNDLNDLGDLEVFADFEDLVNDENLVLGNDGVGLLGGQIAAMLQQLNEEIDDLKRNADERIDASDSSDDELDALGLQEDLDLGKVDDINGGLNEKDDDQAKDQGERDRHQANDIKQDSATRRLSMAPSLLSVLSTGGVRKSNDVLPSDKRRALFGDDLVAFSTSSAVRRAQASTLNESKSPSKRNRSNEDDDAVIGVGSPSRGDDGLGHRTEATIKNDGSPLTTEQRLPKLPATDADGPRRKSLRDVVSKVIVGNRVTGAWTADSLNLVNPSGARRSVLYISNHIAEANKMAKLLSSMAMYCQKRPSSVSELVDAGAIDVFLLLVEQYSTPEAMLGELAHDSIGMPPARRSVARPSEEEGAEISSDLTPARGSDIGGVTLSQVEGSPNTILPENMESTARPRGMSFPVSAFASEPSSPAVRPLGGGVARASSGVAQTKKHHPHTAITNAAGFLLILAAKKRPSSFNISHTRRLVALQVRKLSVIMEESVVYCAVNVSSDSKNSTTRDQSVTNAVVVGGISSNTTVVADLYLRKVRGLSVLEDGECGGGGGGASDQHDGSARKSPSQEAANAVKKGQAANNRNSSVTFSLGLCPRQLRDLEEGGTSLAANNVSSASSANGAQLNPLSILIAADGRLDPTPIFEAIRQNFIKNDWGDSVLFTLANWSGDHLLDSEALREIANGAERCRLRIERARRNAQQVIVEEKEETGAEGLWRDPHTKHIRGSVCRWGQTLLLSQSTRWITAALSALAEEGHDAVAEALGLTEPGDSIATASTNIESRSVRASYSPFTVSRVNTNMSRGGGGNEANPAVKVSSEKKQPFEGLLCLLYLVQRSLLLPETDGAGILAPFGGAIEQRDGSPSLNPEAASVAPSPTAYETRSVSKGGAARDIDVSVAASAILRSGSKKKSGGSSSSSSVAAPYVYESLSIIEHILNADHDGAYLTILSVRGAHFQRTTATATAAFPITPMATLAYSLLSFLKHTVRLFDAECPHKDTLRLPTSLVKATAIVDRLVRVPAMAREVILPALQPLMSTELAVYLISAMIVREESALSAYCPTLPSVPSVGHPNEGKGYELVGVASLHGDFDRTTASPVDSLLFSLEHCQYLWCELSLVLTRIVTGILMGNATYLAAGDASIARAKRLPLSSADSFLTKSQQSKFRALVVWRIEHVGPLMARVRKLIRPSEDRASRRLIAAFNRSAGRRGPLGDGAYRGPASARGSVFRASRVLLETVGRNAGSETFVNTKSLFNPNAFLESYSSAVPTAKAATGATAATAQFEMVENLMNSLNALIECWCSYFTNVVIQQAKDMRDSDVPSLLHGIASSALLAQELKDEAAFAAPALTEARVEPRSVLRDDAARKATSHTMWSPDFLPMASVFSGAGFGANGHRGSVMSSAAAQQPMDSQLYALLYGGGAGEVSLLSIASSTSSFLMRALRDANAARGGTWALLGGSALLVAAINAPYAAHTTEGISSLVEPLVTPSPSYAIRIEGCSDDETRTSSPTLTRALAKTKDEGAKNSSPARSELLSSPPTALRSLSTAASTDRDGTVICARGGGHSRRSLLITAFSSFIGLKAREISELLTSPEISPVSPPGLIIQPSKRLNKMNLDAAAKSAALPAPDNSKGGGHALHTSSTSTQMPEEVRQEALISTANSSVHRALEMLTPPLVDLLGDIDLAVKAAGAQREAKFLCLSLLDTLGGQATACLLAGVLAVSSASKSSPNGGHIGDISVAFSVLGSGGPTPSSYSPIKRRINTVAAGDADEEGGDSSRRDVPGLSVFSPVLNRASLKKGVGGLMGEARGAVAISPPPPAVEISSTPLAAGLALDGTASSALEDFEVASTASDTFTFASSHATFQTTLTSRGGVGHGGDAASPRGSMLGPLTSLPQMQKGDTRGVVPPGVRSAGKGEPRHSPPHLSDAERSARDERNTTTALSTVATPSPVFSSVSQLVTQVLKAVRRLDSIAAASNDNLALARDRQQNTAAEYAKRLATAFSEVCRAVAPQPAIEVSAFDGPATHEREVKAYSIPSPPPLHVRLCADGVGAEMHTRQSSPTRVVSVPVPDGCVGHALPKAVRLWISGILTLLLELMVADDRPDSNTIDGIRSRGETAANTGATTGDVVSTPDALRYRCLSETDVVDNALSFLSSFISAVKPSVHRPGGEASLAIDCISWRDHLTPLLRLIVRCALSSTGLHELITRNVVSMSSSSCSAAANTTEGTNRGNRANEQGIDDGVEIASSLVTVMRLITEGSYYAQSSQSPASQAFKNFAEKQELIKTDESSKSSSPIPIPMVVLTGLPSAEDLSVVAEFIAVMSIPPSIAAQSAASLQNAPAEFRGAFQKLWDVFLRDHPLVIKSKDAWTVVSTTDKAQGSLDELRQRLTKSFWSMCAEASGKSPSEDQMSLIEEVSALREQVSALREDKALLERKLCGQQESNRSADSQEKDHSTPQLSLNFLSSLLQTPSKPQRTEPSSASRDDTEEEEEAFLRKISIRMSRDAKEKLELGEAYARSGIECEANTALLQLIVCVYPSTLKKLSARLSAMNTKNAAQSVNDHERIAQSITNLKHAAEEREVAFLKEKGSLVDEHRAALDGLKERIKKLETDLEKAQSVSLKSTQTKNSPLTPPPSPDDATKVFNKEDSADNGDETNYSTTPKDIGDEAAIAEARAALLAGGVFRTLGLTSHRDPRLESGDTVKRYRRHPQDEHLIALATELRLAKETETDLRHRLSIMSAREREWTVRAAADEERERASTPDPDGEKGQKTKTKTAYDRLVEARKSFVAHTAPHTLAEVGAAQDSEALNAYVLEEDMSDRIMLFARHNDHEGLARLATKMMEAHRHMAATHRKYRRELAESAAIVASKQERLSALVHEMETFRRDSFLLNHIETDYVSMCNTYERLKKTHVRLIDGLAVCDEGSCPREVRHNYEDEGEEAEPNAKGDEQSMCKALDRSKVNPIDRDCGVRTMSHHEELSARHRASSEAERSQHIVVTEEALGRLRDDRTIRRLEVKLKAASQRIGRLERELKEKNTQRIEETVAAVEARQALRHVTLLYETDRHGLGWAHRRMRRIEKERHLADEQRIKADANASAIAKNCDYQLKRRDDAVEKYQADCEHRLTSIQKELRAAKAIIESQKQSIARYDATVERLRSRVDGLDSIFDGGGPLENGHKSVATPRRNTAPTPNGTTFTSTSVSGLASSSRPSSALRGKVAKKDDNNNNTIHQHPTVTARHRRALEASSVINTPRAGAGPKTPRYVDSVWGNQDDSDYLSSEGGDDGNGQRLLRRRPSANAEFRVPSSVSERTSTYDPHSDVHLKSFFAWKNIQRRRGREGFAVESTATAGTEAPRHNNNSDTLRGGRNQSVVARASSASAAGRRK